LEPLLVLNFFPGIKEAFLEEEVTKFGLEERLLLLRRAVKGYSWIREEVV